MPKTHGNLYEKIYDFGNLHRAYIKARRCKRYKGDVLLFSANLEEELITLQNELIWGTYRTGRYRRFTVYEPKTREIAALPFRDRVLHHAVCNIVEPLFERKFIKDSYACRAGKGTHAGSSRLVNFLRRAQRGWGKLYCLKADISKYFPSIDHDVLKRIVRRTIRCKRTLSLINEIIDSSGEGKGLPIGNLTSQLFANVYLNELDHLVKEEMKIKFYLRYMDDFVILHNDKKQLHQRMADIEGFLKHKLRLELNPKTSVFQVLRGVDFLGYRTWATHKLLRKRGIVGMRRRLKRLMSGHREGRVDSKTIKAVIASWMGHVKQASSYNVIKRVLGSVEFNGS